MVKRNRPSIPSCLTPLESEPFKRGPNKYQVYKVYMGLIRGTIWRLPFPYDPKIHESKHKACESLQDSRHGGQFWIYESDDQCGGKFFTVKTLEPEKNDQISVGKNHGGNNAPRIQSTKYPLGCWLLQNFPRQSNLEGCRCVQLAALTFPHLAGPTLVPSLSIGSS